MIAAIEDFGGYFEGIHRRTLRDIDAIRERGLALSPPGGDGEAGWPVARLIGHTASTSELNKG
jgi:hypothetical protein